MSFLGLSSGIWSGLGGFASSAATGWLGSFFGKDKLDYAKELMEYQYKHRHQWEVEDLRKAGLNPILSAQNSAASVGSLSVPGGEVSDIGHSATEIMRARKERALLDSQIDVQKAEAEKLKSDAQRNRDVTQNEINRLNLDVDRFNSQAELWRSEIMKNGASAREADARVDEIKTNLVRLNAEIELLKLKGKTEQANALAAVAAAAMSYAGAASYGASAKESAARTEQIRSNLPSIKTYNDFVKNHPTAYKWIRNIGALTGAVKDVAMSAYFVK